MAGETDQVCPYPNRLAAHWAIVNVGALSSVPINPKRSIYREGDANRHTLARMSRQS
jgi:hypothetical protein